MDYLYEHTLLSQYGHLLIIVAFVGSLFSAFCYATAIRSHQKFYAFRTRMGRGFFLVAGISALAAIGVLYYIMLNRFFEFHYVWKYTNESMNSAFMLASFWSGQEGSLLLWVFWIIIFSLIFLYRFKSWESHVMPVVSFTLAFLFSMLLGVYLGDIKIGSNPFILVRELPENIGQAWTTMPDYMQKVAAFQDGVGLNPLLQNYWMVIHPPVLFAGFALTLFPFSLGLAGLYRGNLRLWLKPAITWSVAGLFTLGAGILLGGAWAYEALSFGGFWAWDPVENASLVPWLILLAGNHQLLITQKRQKGYFMALLFIMLPFIMVLYSSFLTRSGILGESSVHSFTENGLMLHLFLFLFTFIALSFISLMRNNKIRWVYLVANVFLLVFYLSGDQKGIIFISWSVVNVGFLIYAYHKFYPHQKKDDHLSSREFWMLAGITLLVISAIQITISTSIPVINELFNTRFDAFTNLTLRNQYYGTWQVPLAILVVGLMGVTQILNYRKTNSVKKKLSRLKKPLIFALITTIIMGFVFAIKAAEWQYLLLLLVSVFAVVANGKWMTRLMKKNVLQAGAALSHVGFGLLIIGALISSVRKTPISENNAAFNLQLLDQNFLNNENVLLRKGDTVRMHNYFISYRGKERQGVNINYKIDYFDANWNHQNNSWHPGDRIFSLAPRIQQNEQFGQVSEPDTRHYWSHDVFTHIKWADTEMNDHGHPDDDFMNRIFKEVELGNSYQHDNLKIDLEKIYLVSNPVEKGKLDLKKEDIVIKASVLLQDINNPMKKDRLQPVFIVRDSAQLLSQPTYSEKLQVELEIAELTQKPNTILLALREKEYLVMQAMVFPAMNLLWSGCMVMLVGLGLVLYKRWKS